MAPATVRRRIEVCNGGLPVTRRPVLLNLLAWLFLAAACGPGLPAASNPSGAESPAIDAVPDRTLVVAVRNEPSTIAAVAPAGGGAASAFNVRPFNAYLELIDERGQPRPYLAEGLPELNTESWQVFPDGRMETRYQLKSNLSWHDGAPLDAADFVFAWRVYSVPELGVASTLPVSLMEGLSAPDSRSLVIRWRRLYPNAGVLPIGPVQPGLPALPRHLLEARFNEAQWDAFANHPFWTREFVGLGPYRLEQWEPGSYLEGVAFSGHVLGRPRIGRYRVQFIGDSNTALANLRAGAVQMAADNALGFQQWNELKREWAPGNAGNMLRSAGSWRAIWPQFRAEYANPSSILDLRVRKALAHSTDRQGINETIWDGEGVMLDSGIAVPGADSFPVIDGAVIKYPYDLPSAERLMNEASYLKGSDGLLVHPTLGRFVGELKSTSGGDAETERSVLANGWRRAGFEMQEAPVSATESRDPQARSIFQTMFVSTANLFEINLIISFTTQQIARPETRWLGDNRGGWSNVAFDRLADAFNETLEANERMQQRIRMARILSEELPAIPLYLSFSPIPFISALRGPVQVSLATTGGVSWNLYEWEMR
ncbi:MAG: hypothetical protein HW416_1427 [Chloroflexi bacterium]|nr:hypothetical protein [Chloroflexota bacterium]